MSDHRDVLRHLLQRLESGPITRRRWLQAAAALAAWSVLGRVSAARAAESFSKPRFVAYPFTLGVASGYPTQDGITLWTRLAPSPLEANGGMTPESVSLHWQIASDEAFAKIVAEGNAPAFAELAHSVRVEVSGLQPGRWYFYRFAAGDETSPVGRTRTADAPGTATSQLKFAHASCAHYEQGYFGAYRHLAQENLDLIVFLGDYIYEGTWGANLVRRFAPANDAITLADYRIRHAQYKTDAYLQQAHAAAPWLCTWDDHEVDNDYAADRSEHLDPRFLQRRAAAYQAYFEHMPLPNRMLPDARGATIYTHADFGDLARFYLLDDRQYRSYEVCPKPGMAGSNTVGRDCTGLEDPDRTLLGRAQERWLYERFGDTHARWNVLAQQSMMSRWNGKVGSDQSWWTDSWDGYPPSRRALLDQLVAHKTRNPLVIGGDIHANVVANVHLDPADPKSPVVASEFCGTSVCSEGLSYETFWQPPLRDNPHVLLADSRFRGYAVTRLSAKRAEVELRVLDDVSRRDAGISTVQRYVVEDGVAGVQKA